MFDAAEVRRGSLAEAERLGYRTNPDLPLLDAEPSAHAKADVVARVLALHGAIAAAYGFPADTAAQWLVQEDLTAAVAPSEREVLDGGGDPGELRERVEAIFAFAWALGFRGALDFAEPCDDALISLLPDLRQMASSTGFSARAALRPADELATALDLAYCLHWAVVSDTLEGAAPDPERLAPAAIVERRRALEWILGDDDWDDVALDT